MIGDALQYILDTSVLLSDPKCLERLESYHIVIPLVVITELEGKRNHPDLGFAARSALRKLESYRSQIGDFSHPLVTKAGGSISIELNHVSDSILPEAFRLQDNDTRILSVAANLAYEGTECTLLTKDLPLRIKASVIGIPADDYSDNSVGLDWDGVGSLYLTTEEIDELYDRGHIQAPSEVNDPTNTNYIISGPNSSALARLNRYGQLQLSINARPQAVSPRSAEQRFAIDLLMDQEVPIVSMGGNAGVGKTFLALASGIEQVLESKIYDKIVIFRPMYAVGGQDLGYLPGTADEKMEPWKAAIYDSLNSFCSDHVIDHLLDNKLIEIQPLTYIRGRSISNSFIIIEEAQNLDSMTLLTALSRTGNDSKVVLTHDIAQRDNMRVGRYDGIASVVAKLTGSPLFGHIKLYKSERSAVAELVSTLLD